MATKGTTSTARPPSGLSQVSQEEPPLLCPFTTGLQYALSSSTNASNSTSPTVSLSVQSTSDTRAGLSNATANIGSHPSIGTIPGEVIVTLPTFIDQKVAGTKPRSDAREVVPIEDEASLRTYFEEELNFKRLNKIHGHLWMCGRPMKARALHKQLMMGRRVVLTEQADLHLLTYANIVMLKPLPAYMLSKEIWETYFCHDRDLHKAACGMLLSYTWLIRSANDFRLAQEDSRCLLPDALTYPEWRRIVIETFTRIDADTLHQVNKRFQFGELRLGRINKIYRLNPRFAFQNFVRGYLYQYNRYGPFLHRNVSWILGVSVLLSLGLSAMQVGTGVSQLRDNDMFNRASYGFVVFVCALVLAILAFVLVICAGVYAYNMVAAIHHSSTEQSRREKLARTKGFKRVETTPVQAGTTTGSMV